MNERILNIIKHFHNGKKIDFARNLNVTPGNVGDWCRGKSKPSASVQLLISEKYGINLDWLQTGEGEMLDPNRKLPDAKGVLRAIAVPVLAKVPCGYPRESITDAFVEDYILLPNVKPDQFIVQACGDSMEPTIRDGDYALVHPQPSADHMDVVVAKDPFGAVTIKRLKKITPDKFVLTYDNSRYQGMAMDINEEWVVIGKVIKVISVRNV